MNPSAFFIYRPVATTLLTIGLALAGFVAFLQLPVAPLPQVDFPSISVSAAMPGASPETMAATIATPLERSLGRIAGITEMTSTSSLGSTRINLQFELDRDIDGAARDVQAAINAASSLLPSNLPSRPNYRKVNPAESPIMILALTSTTVNRGQMYDAASTILAQKIAQIPGIGQVAVGGSSLPAVRVELNPGPLAKYGISLDDVGNAIATANSNRPKGSFEANDRHWQIYANDQAKRAADYTPLIVAYRNNAPIRIADLGEAIDSVEDLRNSGLKNGQPSILLFVGKQPGANIIETVEQVKSMLPQLRALLPDAINLSVAVDRTLTIRASVSEAERSLLIAIGLVILVVLLFLRNLRTALIPIIAVPVSLIGACTVMYLCKFSLDNLSLMALTIATGFVVDDAIVVLENINRHIEKGLSPFEAALLGAREVGFTVLSMSLSLIAVFIPILLMGGIVGRLFREFAVTLSAAVLVSLVVSLTVTPMLCARWLTVEKQPSKGLSRAIERVFIRLQNSYERSLRWALNHAPVMLLVLFACIALNIHLYNIVPKGFFPTQDNGRLMGSIQADQSISFQAMQKKLYTFANILQNDPAITDVIGFVGGNQNFNTGQMFAVLKPPEQRGESMADVSQRLRKKLADEPGASLYLQPVQELRIGARSSASMFEYTLQSEKLSELREWTPKIVTALQSKPGLVDVNSNEQDKGQQISLQVDREKAARFGVTQAAIDSTLYNAFGQRQVSVIYNTRNQYHVVMELAPQYWQNPDILNQLYVSPSSAANKQKTATNQIPLSSLASFAPTNVSLTVNHQSQFAAATLSFGLKPGVSLSTATQLITQTMNDIGVPSSVRGSFQGNAKAFQESLQNQPWLILAAIVTIYIVLGVLYESYIHPLTILSTLPSAGMGAIMALMICDTEFSIIALIGVVLLIGIVKKNAIMMIDFALQAQREQGLSSEDAIISACLLRFRPIMMTTLAALLGALPLAMATGYGAELRQPLGISIVGGLLVSQLLTFYTTPVVYLYLDRLSIKSKRLFRHKKNA